MRNCGESGLKNCLGVYCTYNASLSSATEIKCCLCKLMPDFQILITHSWLMWTSHWLPPGSELSFILFNILQTQMRFFLLTEKNLKSYKHYMFLSHEKNT